MNKILRQHRTPLLLVALSILLIFLAAAHYGLVPLSRWASSIVPTKSVSVTAVPLGTTNKPVQILRTGVVESPKSAPVQTEFSGLISQVYVTEGQVVKADQPLVQITRSGASNVQVQNATPSYQSNEPSPQVQATYDNALKNYNQFQKLYEHGAISKRELATVEARLQTATEQLATSPQAQTSPTSSSSSVSTNTITINAQNPGIVTGLSAITGKGVESGQQLMIVDVGEVLVVIHIEQKDLYLLHAGTQAAIGISGQIIPGQVGSIYPEVGVNNVSSFRTHINIPTNTGGILKTGMSVNVAINTGKSIPVHTLPASAVLQAEDGTHYIYLIDNGKALRQQITIGEPIGDLVEVTSSLPEKALIVTSNSSVINPGDTLTVQN